VERGDVISLLYEVWKVKAFIKRLGYRLPKLGEADARTQGGYGRSVTSITLGSTGTYVVLGINALSSMLLGKDILRVGAIEKR
jgi:hypothetical protein